MQEPPPTQRHRHRVICYSADPAATLGQQAHKPVFFKDCDNLKEAIAFVDEQASPNDCISLITIEKVDTYGRPKPVLQHVDVSAADAGQPVSLGT